MSENLIVAGNQLPIEAPTSAEVLILDCSSSMKRFGTAPQEAVEEHRAALRQAEHERQFLFGIVGFSHKAEVLLPLTAIGKMSDILFYCKRGTLLWATVDSCIEQLMGWFSALPSGDAARVRVKVDVMSDGQDNKSPRHVYPARLQERSRLALDLGWKLYAYGIDIDGTMLARDMGFPAENATTAESTLLGIRESVQSMTQSSVEGEVVWRIRYSNKSSAVHDSPK